MIAMMTMAGIQRRTFDIPGFYRKFCVKLVAYKRREKMSDQTEQIVREEENEPIYYRPRSLNLVATISGILSWVVLVGFIADIAVQSWSIQAQLAGQQVGLTKLLSEPAFNSYVFTNLILPVLMGLTFFITLQGVSIGLNALLEIDFNFREPKE